MCDVIDRKRWQDGNTFILVLNGNKHKEGFTMWS